MGLNVKTFNSSGSWTCPAGITTVIVYGMGGGGGGQGGFAGSGITGGYGGDGGLATSLMPVVLDVVPNTSYTITIGAGGVGGTAPGNWPAAGGSTSFGALITWISPDPLGRAWYSIIANYNYVANNTAWPNNSDGNNDGRWNYHDAGFAGRLGAGGTRGTQTTSTQAAGGAGGGGGSGEDIGGTGASGDDAVGAVGGAGVANSGGGGGGGSGGGATGALAGGAGGAGGSGQLKIIWTD